MATIYASFGIIEIAWLLYMSFGAPMGKIY
jgi:hypothetical protein